MSSTNEARATSSNLLSIASNLFLARGGGSNHRRIDSPTDEPPDNVQRYTDQLNILVQDLQENLPLIDENLASLFVAACESTVLAKAARDAAVKARDEATDDQQKADANAAVTAAEAALAKAFDVNVAAAKPILQSLRVLEESDLDGTLEIDTKSLMQCFVLMHGTPEDMGQFANRGPDQAALLDNLLNDSNLLRQVVLASGAKGGKYGPAMQSYDAISKQSTDVGKHDILQRFALACSLELAVPLSEFDTPNISVDPVRRYLHYERAYLDGELDPAFVDRATWECRMIGNCDATEEQLCWGRMMLRNYQPSQILLEDYTWRYCRAVRTEVGYRTPEWTDSPHTYQQIISGGGKCGPRAWFGRFICKAFGIPTWGARQPGHAMMHHWTPAGWIPVLGADWSYSWWEGRCGLDFLLETQARAVGEDSYFDSVCCLEMIGRAVMGEPGLDAMVVMPSPISFWCSLALMAKHILAKKSLAMKTAAAAAAAVTPLPSLSCGVNEPDKNIIHQRLQAKDEKEHIIIEADGKIIIPATSCSEPRQSTAHVQFTPSFLGGSQLHHTEGDTFEYTITDLPADRAGEYSLSLRLCNVHLKQQPLLLTVSSEGARSSTSSGGAEDQDVVDVLSIVVPYTVGKWAWTGPVTIHLAPGTNVLSFSRETPNFGLSIKDIICTQATDQY